MASADIFDDFSSFHEVVLLACTVAELNAFKAAAAKASKAKAKTKAKLAFPKSEAIKIQKQSYPGNTPSAPGNTPSAPPLSAIALYRCRARKLPR